MDKNMGYLIIYYSNGIYRRYVMLLIFPQPGMNSCQTYNFWQWKNNIHKPDYSDVSLLHRSRIQKIKNSQKNCFKKYLEDAKSNSEKVWQAFGKAHVTGKINTKIIINTNDNPKYCAKWTQYRWHQYLPLFTRPTWCRNYVCKTINIPHWRDWQMTT